MKKEQERRMRLEAEKKERAEKERMRAEREEAADRRRAEAQTKIDAIQKEREECYNVLFRLLMYPIGDDKLSWNEPKNKTLKAIKRTYPTTKRIGSNKIKGSVNNLNECYGDLSNVDITYNDKKQIDVSYGISIKKTDNGIDIVQWIANYISWKQNVTFSRSYGFCSLNGSIPLHNCNMRIITLSISYDRKGVILISFLLK